MDTIFHEKGSFFTAVDLATLAQQMDEEERRRMSEAGVDSEEYRAFLQAGSQNMDDSGYFSVQVIAAALRVWDLDLVRYTSSDPSAVQARATPASQRAYICNYREHWFTIRRLGRQWFNLNSLLTGPELLSESYVSEFLAQLLQEGYSIFVVMGVLPDCVADRLLESMTVTQPVKPRLISEKLTIESLASGDPELRAAIEASLDGSDGAAGAGSEEAQLQAALAASLCTDHRPAGTAAATEDSEDEQLRAAIALSLQSDRAADAVPASVPTLPAAPPVDSSAVRAQRQAFLDRLQQSGQQPPP